MGKKLDLYARVLSGTARSVVAGRSSVLPLRPVIRQKTS